MNFAEIMRFRSLSTDRFSYMQTAAFLPYGKRFHVHNLVIFLKKTAHFSAVIHNSHLSLCWYTLSCFCFFHFIPLSTTTLSRGKFSLTTIALLDIKEDKNLFIIAIFINIFVRCSGCAHTRHFTVALNVICCMIV